MSLSQWIRGPTGLAGTVVRLHDLDQHRNLLADGGFGVALQGDGSLHWALVDLHPRRKQNPVKVSSAPRPMPKPVTVLCYRHQPRACAADRSMRGHSRISPTGILAVAHRPVPVVDRGKPMGAWLKLIPSGPIRKKNTPLNL